MVVHGTIRAFLMVLYTAIALEYYDMRRNLEQFSAQIQCGMQQKTYSLQVVQYLHDNGCPWSADACYSAIYRVDHTVFSWLYNKGCPYDIDEICRLAVMFGKVDIISILHEQEAISDDDQMTQLLNYAGVLDKLAVAQWLKQHGAQWPLVLW
jgi:hypothetical protein